jgi:hypothetical protein
MPYEFKEKVLTGTPEDFIYPNMKEDDVFTFCINPTGAGILEGYHLNNSDPVLITPDSSLEDVPGIVNVYGLGWTRFRVSNVNGPVTMKSGKSK